MPATDWPQTKPALWPMNGPFWDLHLHKSSIHASLRLAAGQFTSASNWPWASSSFTWCVTNGRPLKGTSTPEEFASRALEPLAWACNYSMECAFTSVAFCSNKSMLSLIVQACCSNLCSMYQEPGQITIGFVTFHPATLLLFSLSCCCSCFLWIFLPFMIYPPFQSCAFVLNLHFALHLSLLFPLVFLGFDLLWPGPSVLCLLSFPF